MLVLILDMSSRQKQLFPRINASSIIVAAFSCFEHVYWGLFMRWSFVQNTCNAHANKYVNHIGKFRVIIKRNFRIWNYIGFILIYENRRMFREINLEMSVCEMSEIYFLITGLEKKYFSI